MSDTEGNPRKRPRLERDSRTNPELPLSSERPPPVQEKPQPVYEPGYNALDGDLCVIRVEDTYFKLHRYLLSRDSLVFKDMLSLPQTGEPQGVSDAAPIVLPDKLEEFRILCWAIYALPTELNAKLKAGADVNSLRILATIANKYQFLSIEEWAITTIILHCRQHKFIDKLSLDKTPGYLKVASQSSSKELRDIVEDAIIKKIEERSIDWNIALKPIEEYGSSRLKGMVHYHLLILQDISATTAQSYTSAANATIWVDPSCNRAYTTYRGFFALTKWWEHFLSTEGEPTSLPRSSTCSPESHTRACQALWPVVFRTLVAFTDAIQPKIDILERLAELQRQTNSATTLNAASVLSLNRLCIAKWSIRVGNLRQKLLDTMGDKFYGSPSSKVDSNSTAH